ncbi:cysteine and tyrosine-rich protein 1 [Lampetra fluviatilis]
MMTSRLRATPPAVLAVVAFVDVALAQCYDVCDQEKYCCSSDDTAYCCSYLSYVGNVLTGAAIAGIVLGLVFLLGIIAAVAVCICSCLKSSQRRVGMATPSRSNALSTVTVAAGEGYSFPPPPPYSPYSPTVGADLPPPYAAQSTGPGPGYPPPPYPGK